MAMHGGFLRRNLRWLGVALGFVTLVPLHVVMKLFGQRDWIPPIFLGTMARLAGVRVRTEGKPRPGALLLANHLSGLTVHGGLKWLCDQNDTVFITRDQRGSVAGQVEQVRAALGARPLTIFPEGTTDDGTALLPFRSSLLAAVEPLAHEIPIQPVALDYADAPAIAWFAGEPGLVNVRKILSRRRTELTIRFLEPLAGAALTNRKTMTAAAQAAIAAALAK